MNNLKKIFAYPFAFIFINLLKLFSFILPRHSRGKRLLTLTSVYAEMTSSKIKSLDKDILLKDYDALLSIGRQMEMINKEDSIGLPLFMQRLFSFIFGKNLFWKDEMIHDLIVNAEQTNGESIYLFAKRIYDETPLFLKYGNEQTMLSDLEDLISRTLGYAHKKLSA